jgi:hypothetical protein
MVTSMTLKRVWSFRYTTVECVEVWITHIGGYPGKYNPAKTGDGCKFTQIIYLWTFTFCDGSIRNTIYYI